MMYWPATSSASSGTCPACAYRNGAHVQLRRIPQGVSRDMAKAAVESEDCSVAPCGGNRQGPHGAAKGGPPAASAAADPRDCRRGRGRRPRCIRISSRGARTNSDAPLAVGAVVAPEVVAVQEQEHPATGLVADAGWPVRRRPPAPAAAVRRHRAGATTTSACPAHWGSPPPGETEMPPAVERNPGSFRPRTQRPEPVAGIIAWAAGSGASGGHGWADNRARSLADRRRGDNAPIPPPIGDNRLPLSRRRPWPASHDIDPYAVQFRPSACSGHAFGSRRALVRPDVSRRFLGGWWLEQAPPARRAPGGGDAGSNSRTLCSTPCSA